MDPITMALIGGAIGGLTSKKPLKGALLGAAGGALTGGMGGLLSGGANAGTAAAGSAAGQTAGLLGLPSSAAWGQGSQSAMLAAQNEGFGATGQKLLAEAAGTKVPLGVNAAAGMESAMGGLRSANEAMKPIKDAAGTAMMVKSMFGSGNQMQPAQLPQAQPFDASGLLSTNNQQLQALQQKRQQRRGGV